MKTLNKHCNVSLVHPIFDGRIVNELYILIWYGLQISIIREEASFFLKDQGRSISKEPLNKPGKDVQIIL